jgi:tripartite-type tricarboxylate transporter receptor subunit TctC
MNLSHLKLALTALLATTILPTASPAQDAYPQRNITLVAATAPGGPGDTAARLIAERMTPILGQQVVVENVGGAGGILGATRVAKADADGYTLLIHQTGITIAPAVNANIQFNVEKDFTTVGLVNTSYSFLIGRKDLPPKDYRELVAWMKSSGSARVAHPGVGSLGHLITLLFAKSAGASVNPIAYRGIGPAMNDVLGGHVDLVWAGAVAAAPMIKDGRVKGYAFGAKERSKLAPEIPSVAELGAPELVIPFWHALFAPAGTPAPIVAKLNAALREALRHPQLLDAYQKSGVEVFPADMLTVEGADKFVRSEIAKWSTAAKLAQ